jgi:hypothetical protein
MLDVYKVILFYGPGLYKTFSFVLVKYLYLVDSCQGGERNLMNLVFCKFRQGGELML